jgi:hypothetical protein
MSCSIAVLSQPAQLGFPLAVVGLVEQEPLRGVADEAFIRGQPPRAAGKVGDAGLMAAVICIGEMQVGVKGQLVGHVAVLAHIGERLLVWRRQLPTLVSCHLY